MTAGELLLSGVGLSSIVICIGVGLTWHPDVKMAIIGARLIVVGIIGAVATIALLWVWQVSQ